MLRSAIFDAAHPEPRRDAGEPPKVPQAQPAVRRDENEQLVWDVGDGRYVGAVAARSARHPGASAALVSQNIVPRYELAHELGESRLRKREVSEVSGDGAGLT